MEITKETQSQLTSPFGEPMTKDQPSEREAILSDQRVRHPALGLLSIILQAGIQALRGQLSPSIAAIAHR